MADGLDDVVFCDSTKRRFIALLSYNVGDHTQLDLGHHSDSPFVDVFLWRGSFHLTPRTYLDAKPWERTLRPD